MPQPPGARQITFGAREGGAPPTVDELLARLQRPIQQTGDDNVAVRRAALQALRDLFLVALLDQLPDPALVPRGASPCELR